MTMKRWRVWLLLLVLGVLPAWAQDGETDLLDDVSKRVPKAVTVLPEPKDLPLPLQAQQRQVMLEVTIVEVDLKSLPAVKDEQSKRDRVAELAQTLKWKELRPGLAWQAPVGTKLNLDKESLGEHAKILASPKLVMLNGQEASLLSGGEIPIPDPEQPDKAIAFRPFGLSMKCTPRIRDVDHVQLDLKLEHTQVAREPETMRTVKDVVTEIASLVTGDKKKVPLPPSVVSGQTVSLTADLAFSETYILALPSNSDPANSVVLFGLMVKDVDQVRDVTEVTPSPLPPGKRVVGKGFNSDAGVTGNITLSDPQNGVRIAVPALGPIPLALEDNAARKAPRTKTGDGPVFSLVVGFEDLAAQPKLQAKSLSIVVPGVNPLGVDLGQRCLLVAVPKHGGRQYEVRLVAQPVVLDVIDVHAGKDSHHADVGLRADSQQVVEQIQNAAKASRENESLYLVPMPERVDRVAQPDLKRVFEHARIRAELAGESGGEKAELIDVADGQKSVRAPINRQIIALLPNPKGNYSNYVSMFHSEQKGVRHIAGLNVFFVSEAALELEALIKETESTTNVTAIEVRDAVLLRGEVTTAGQKQSIVEIAEQFYPKVLDQLRVGKSVTYEKIGVDFENGTEPVRMVTTVTERSEPLNATRAADDQATGTDRQPSKTERQGANLRSSEATRSQPTSVIQQAKAEEPSKLAETDGKKNDTARDASKLRGRGMTRLAPHKLPSVEELKELRDDVIGLRRDVQRLSEQLERDREKVDSAKLRSEKIQLQVDPLNDKKKDSERNSEAKKNANQGRPAESKTRLASRTAAERVLEMRLNRTISLKVTGSLKDALSQWKKAADINFVVDQGGFDQEALSVNEAVAVDFNDVSAKSALSLLLESVSKRLGWVIEDEAVKVTSKLRAHGPPVTKTYPVADLITPLPDFDVPMSLNGNSQLANNTKKTQAPDFQALIELITETVHPDSWSHVGGSGRVVFEEKTLSLVIHQHPGVHEEIANLLSQLRRLQELQVIVEMRLLQMPDRLAEQISSATEQVVSAGELKRITDMLEGDRRSNILQYAKATLFNGQTVALFDGDTDKPNLSMQLSAAISGDRKAARLNFKLGESFEKLNRHAAETVKDGDSFLIDVTSEFSHTGQLLRKLPIGGNTEQGRQLARQLHQGSKGRVLLLVTSKIIEVKEEELHLDSDL